MNREYRRARVRVNKEIVKMLRKVLIVTLIIPILIMIAPAAEVRADATSPWFKVPTTQVLSTGVGAVWDNGGVGTVSVIVESGAYKMWYSGYDSTAGLLQIGYATSPDGKTWTRGNSGNPVLTPTGVNEAEGIGAPRVVLDGGIYKMWYTGYKLVAGEFVPQIFYATSPNGITAWTRQAAGAPVLIPGPGAFDLRGVYSGAVIKDGGTYKMWYTGRGGAGMLGTSKIGYATSADGGLTWVKSGGTGGPVLSGDVGTWNVDGVAVPSVVKTDQFYMWFTGYAGITAGTIQVKIGLATSADGITWVKTANPVLDKAASGWSAGGVGAPSVLNRSAELGYMAPFEMWYSGLDTSLNSQVGYAATPTTSYDLPVGWNLFSTPFSLDSTYRTFGSLATLTPTLATNVSIAYYYDPDYTVGGVSMPWRQVTSDYALTPGDAIYIKMTNTDTVRLVSNTLPAISSKSLKTGWNLASLGEYPSPAGRAVDSALTSIFLVGSNFNGYAQVVSPGPNQPAFTYLRGGGAPPSMLISKGYWIFMTNPGTLGGFTATPLP